MYVATPEKGYCVNSINNDFQVCHLKDGILETKHSVEYINITEIQNDEIVPTKALKFNKTLYQFNPETLNLEIEDIIDEDIEILMVSTSTITFLNKNIYVKKQKFNATEESDRQDSSYNPIGGLFVDSSHISLKTQNFQVLGESPKHGDIITYGGNNWIIEETTQSFIYTPKKVMILHISLKLLK